MKADFLKLSITRTLDLSVDLSRVILLPRGWGGGGGNIHREKGLGCPSYPLEAEKALFVSLKEFSVTPFRGIELKKI